MSDARSPRPRFTLDADMPEVLTPHGEQAPAPASSNGAGHARAGNGAVPNGVPPNGVVPNGVAGNGAGHAAASNGASDTEAASNGAKPAGAKAAGSKATGAKSTGTKSTGSRSRAAANDAGAVTTPRGATAASTGHAATPDLGRTQRIAAEVIAMLRAEFGSRAAAQAAAALPQAHQPAVPQPRPAAAGVARPVLDDAEPQPETLDLPEILAVLRRRAGIIAGVAVLVMGVSVYLGHGVRPQYRAQASVRLANARQAIASNLADDAQPVTDYNEDRRVSQIQVLTSRSLVATAVDRDPVRLRLALDGAPASVLRDATVAAAAGGDSVVLEFAGSGVRARGAAGAAEARYGEALDVAGARFTVPARPLADRATLHVATRDDAVARVMGGLRAKQREQADVIDVSFTDTDPRFAQQAVNAIVQTFADQNLESAQQMSKRRRQFVEGRLRQNDSLLAVAQGELARFRAREQTFDAKDRFASESRDRSTTEAQREALVSERAVYQTVLGTLERAKSTSGAERARAVTFAPAGAANPVVGGLFSQLATYATRRDSLTTGQWAHAATHPDVQQLDTLIAAAQGKLAEAAQSQVSTLSARIGRLDELASRNVSAMQRMPGVEAEELRLSNEVESVRRLGDELRAEQQRASIAEAVPAGQVEILDLATLPGAPLGNGPLPRLVLGLAVGLALGCGAAFLRERLDGTIARRADVQRALGLPALSVTPRIKSAGPRGLLARFRRRPAGEGTLALAVDPAAAESYVTLRTNLLYSQHSGALHTIAVTSTAPGEGKTTVAGNLARAYALQGSRVLLVDCDLRRSRLHRAFGVASHPGLTDVLLDETLDPAEVAQPARAVPGLQVLPAGRSTDVPSELLGGPAMTALLDRAKAAFDVVILDTPPVLAVSDAAVLGARVDGVAFVVRAGATPRDAARTSLEQLAAVGARVVGAVLNDPDDRVARYSGYYYYGEYYARPARA